LKKWFSRFVTILIIGLILIVCISVISSKMNGSKLTIFGYQFMVVLNGSMAPTFDTGSLIVMKSLPFDRIQETDIVTYKDQFGGISTQRVAVLDNEQLITMGDHQEFKDPSSVKAEQIIGKVYFWMPYLGYLLEFSRSKTGLILFLGFPGIYLVAGQMLKLYHLLTTEDGEEKEIY
jgi:signal peptidase